MESSKKMRPALKLTIAFLVVAALLTFFSKTLYNLNIPTVRVATMTAGNLRKVYQTQGVTVPIVGTGVYADDALKVLTVLCEQGQTVKKGDVLATLDVSALELELAALTAECDRLDYYLTQTYGKEAKRLAEQDAAVARGKRDALADRIEMQRTLAAPCDGTVTAVSVRPGMVTMANSPVVEVAEAGTGCAVYVTMDAKTATDYSVGGAVSVAFQGGWGKLEGKIGNMTADASGTAVVRVDIQSGVGFGAVVDLRFSKATVDYPYLVPLEAVVDGTYVYVIDRTKGVLGTETAMRRVRVTVEDADNESAAVTGSFEGADTVVVGSTGAWENGRVKIYHED